MDEQPPPLKIEFSADASDFAATMRRVQGALLAAGHPDLSELDDHLDEWYPDAQPEEWPR
jgi:hypothetical protein